MTFQALSLSSSNEHSSRVSKTLHEDLAPHIPIDLIRLTLSYLYSPFVFAPWYSEEMISMTGDLHAAGVSDGRLLAVSGITLYERDVSARTQSRANETTLRVETYLKSGVIVQAGDHTYISMQGKLFVGKKTNQTISQMKLLDIDYFQRDYRCYFDALDRSLAVSCNQTITVFQDQQVYTTIRGHQQPHSLKWMNAYTLFFESLTGACTYSRVARKLTTHLTTVSCLSTVNVGCTSLFRVINRGGTEEYEPHLHTYALPSFRETGSMRLDHTENLLQISAFTDTVAVLYTNKLVEFWDATNHVKISAQVLPQAAYHPLSVFALHDTTLIYGGVTVGYRNDFILHLYHF